MRSNGKLPKIQLTASRPKVKIIVIIPKRQIPTFSANPQKMRISGLGPFSNSKTGHEKFLTLDGNTSLHDETVEPHELKMRLQSASIPKG